jgi:hypothetical protein
MAILIAGSVGPTAIPSIPFRLAPFPISLPGAASYMIPAGPHVVNPGDYTELQQYDGVLGVWRKARYPGMSPVNIESDGANYRLFNTTGCAVGAIITGGGTSYTSAPAVTASFGGSTWRAIVGGSISTTVTVTTAGLYNYVPTLVCSDPPAGGIRASAIAVLGGGGITSVTVINAGAGYGTQVPTWTIVPDPRETAAGGGVLTSTLVNVGVVTAVICTDPGTSTSTSVPTLTFTGGTTSTAASATAIMNFVVTGWAVVGAGSSLGTSVPLVVESMSGKVTAAAAATSTDVQLDTELQFNRQARFMGATNATGGIIASNTSLTIIDNGWGFQQSPSLYVVAPFLLGAAQPSITTIVGAVTDTSTLQRLVL